MAQQVIGVGTVAGDGTGDPGRTAFTKVNANFTEIYTSFIATGAITAAGFVVTGSAIPANGVYLPAAGSLGFASSSTLRLSVNSTGNWVSVAPTAGVAWTINGLSGQHPLVVNGAGATAASTSQVYEPLYSAVAVKDIATSDSGSFTGTLTGCTTSPTATFNWVRSGGLVTIDCSAGLTATSNTTACTVTGVSAALTPARTQRVAAILTDNTVQVIGWVQISGTTLSFQMGNPAPSLTGFTAAGTKGVTANMSLTYSLL